MTPAIHPADLHREWMELKRRPDGLARDWHRLQQQLRASDVHQDHWQTWRDEDGQWVPDGWIKPGFYADPPAFDPLPGERLSTPGFEGKAFQPSALGPQPSAADVVVPLSAGSPHDDAELRYALRSIEKHLENLGRVWIVGHRPEWLVCEEARESRESRESDSFHSRDSRAIHLPFTDAGRSKDVNIIRKIEAACRAGVSDRFIFWSDDQVLLRPLAFSQLGPYCWGGLPVAGNGRWHRRLAATAEWLRSQGLDAAHCDTHVPIPMDRMAFLELAHRTRERWQFGDGVTVGTWYCNAAGRHPLTPSPRHPVTPSPPHPLTPSPMGHRKATVEAAVPVAVLRQSIAGRWFLGFNDAGFTPGLRALLDELFPEKCRWEDDGGLPANPANESRARRLSSSDSRDSRVTVLSGPPTLSIIIPTIGRPTLNRTLDSIRAQQLVEGDEVLIVQDGPEDPATRATVEASGVTGRYLSLDRHYGDFGATPRNHGMAHARADYLAFMDDDDVYRPGAFAAIRRAAERDPGRPLMFRFYVTGRQETIWQDMTVRPGNVGSLGIVAPNRVNTLGQWGPHRGSDFAFIHGTLSKWPPGSLRWCPKVIATYLDPGFTSDDIQRAPLTRNLLYHIYPIADNEEWRLNVQRLKQYWDVFNGRKLVAIAVDAKTVSVAEVQAEFRDDSIEWMVAPNDPHLGEVPTFAEGLRRLRSLDAFEATFYAHAKGVLNSCSAGVPAELRQNVVPSVRRWRNAMYDYCLGRGLEKLDWILKTRPCDGCLLWPGNLKRRRGPNDAPCYWHYSGTFFWFNHAHYFGHPLAFAFADNRWAVEYHLGAMFSEREAVRSVVAPPADRGRLYQMTGDEWDRLLTNT